MLEFDTRPMTAGASAAAAKPAGAVVRTLSPTALTITNQPLAAAYSPIVLAGTVRLIEFGLVLLTGLAIYLAYVVPIEGFAWRYLAATASIAVLATLSFQAADIYQVQAFRGYEKQYFRLASAWSIVFLIAIGISFFTKAGDQFSRIWLGSYFVAGLILLIGFRRAGRFACRTARFRHPYRRRVRRSG
jgi:CoA-binding domain